MKYIHQENDKETKLSKIINVNQKQPLPFEHKGIQKAKKITFSTNADHTVKKVSERSEVIVQNESR